MKKFIQFIAFCLVVLLCYQAVGFCVVSRESSNRLKFHEFYQSDEYQVVAVGPSSLQNGFVPETADELLGKKSFNLGTSSQQMEGTYYLTREAIKRQKVDTVILDVSYAILFREPGAAKATQIITDYMKGANRYAFILDAMSPDQWATTIFATLRNHSASLTEVRKNIRAKLSPEYRSFANSSPWYTNYNSYAGRGLVLHEKENAGYDFMMRWQEAGGLDDYSQPVNDEQLSYLEKTIQYCQEQGVRVLVVSYPKANLYLRHCGDYTAMHALVQSIADRNGVDFFDMNLMRDQDWTDDLMANPDHVSYAGAQLATQWICRWLQGEKAALVRDLPEKFHQDVCGILVDGQYNGDESYTLFWTVDTDTGMDFRYRVKVWDEDGSVLETELLSDPSLILEERPVHMSMELYNAQSGDYLGSALLEG